VLVKKAIGNIKRHFDLVFCRKVRYCSKSGVCLIIVDWVRDCCTVGPYSYISQLSTALIPFFVGTLKSNTKVTPKWYFRIINILYAYGWLCLEFIFVAGCYSEYCED